MNYYIHKKTNKQYSVLQECRMKLGDLWLDGIVYLKDGKMFCRPKADFLQNFDKKTK